jgi:predicted RNA-binding Zn-ribbon protein involved in translation (DUF1610 family)
MDSAALPPPPDPVPPPVRREQSPDCVAPLHRSLDQELVALVRGVSLECPVCGEFVMHVAAAIVCPECGLELRDEAAAAVGLPEGARLLRLHAG